MITQRFYALLSLSLSLSGSVLGFLLNLNRRVRERVWIWETKENLRHINRNVMER